MEHTTPDQVATWLAALFVAFVKAYERFHEEPRRKERIERLTTAISRKEGIPDNEEPPS